MSDLIVARDSFRITVKEAIGCIRKDRRLVIGFTALLVAAGALLGKQNSVTSSTAQLLLTPLPLRANQGGETSDPLASMIARPLGIKSAILICESDEVLEATYKALQDSTEPKCDINSLRQLKKALNYRITIEKETPYDLIYSPIIELTAKAKEPSSARLMVNTWASRSVEAVKRLQKINHQPAATAFSERAEETQQLLASAEQEYRAFKEEHSVAFLTGRIERLLAVREVIDTSRAQAELDAVGARASAKTLQERLDMDDPVVSLKWTPSDGVLSVLGAKLGARPNSDNNELTHDILSVEEINEIYTEVSIDFADQISKASGAGAQLASMDSIVASFTQEVDTVKAQLALAETEDSRLARQVEIYSAAFKHAALNREYAHMASNLEHQPLQVLSQGVEWDAPQLSLAVLTGVIAGFFGFVGACLCSILARLILKPLYLT